MDDQAFRLPFEGEFITPHESERQRFDRLRAHVREWSMMALGRTYESLPVPAGGVPRLLPPGAKEVTWDSARKRADAIQSAEIVDEGWWRAAAAGLLYVLRDSRTHSIEPANACAEAWMRRALVLLWSSPRITVPFVLWLCSCFTGPGREALDLVAALSSVDYVGDELGESQVRLLSRALAAVFIVRDPPPVAGDGVGDGVFWGWPTIEPDFSMGSVPALPLSAEWRRSDMAQPGFYYDVARLLTRLGGERWTLGVEQVLDMALRGCDADTRCTEGCERIADAAMEDWYANPVTMGEVYALACQNPCVGFMDYGMLYRAIESDLDKSLFMKPGSTDGHASSGSGSGSGGDRACPRPREKWNLRSIARAISSGLAGGKPEILDLSTMLGSYFVRFFSSCMESDTDRIVFQCATRISRNSFLSFISGISGEHRIPKTVAVV